MPNVTFRYGRRIIIFWAISSVTLINAIAKDTPAVELKFWYRSFHGTIASKHVKVSLEKVGHHISGNYCYAPCAKNGADQIQLSGEQQQDGISLTETAYNSKSGESIISGRWKLNSGDVNGKGIWFSANDSKSFPVALVEDKNNGRSFPFEIRLLASADPVYGDCSDPPVISEIRLYRNNRLVQTLPTASQGTCDMFLPEIADINFDGYPDLMLAQTLPAAPNIPYDYWIYDPVRKKMIPASKEMEDVTSPELDPIHKMIYVFWRASCCEHGVTTYRWKGKHLVQVDTQTSYFQPEMIDGKLAICYITPEYQKNGRIGFPDAVYLKGTAMHTTHKNLADCSDLSPDDVSGYDGRVEIQIWSSNTSSARLLRTESINLEKVTSSDGKSIYCPNIPVFNKGKIERKLLRNPEQCTNTIDK
jgi:hypothetical protein